jgi:Flp pilus assembly protein TadG
VTFGIFEFGRAWLTVNTMSQASREAVRLAVVTPNLAANNAAVIAKATSILQAAGITTATVGGPIAVANTAPAGAPPAVRVTTDITYRYMTQVGPILGFSFTGTIPLHSEATMRYEL